MCGRGTVERKHSKNNDTRIKIQHHGMKLHRLTKVFIHVMQSSENRSFSHIFDHLQTVSGKPLSKAFYGVQHVFKSTTAIAFTQ